MLYICRSGKGQHQTKADRAHVPWREPAIHHCFQVPDLRLSLSRLSLSNFPCSNKYHCLIVHYANYFLVVTLEHVVISLEPFFHSAKDTVQLLIQCYYPLFTYLSPIHYIPLLNLLSCSFTTSTSLSPVSFCYCHMFCGIYSPLKKWPNNFFLKEIIIYFSKITILYRQHPCIFLLHYTNILTNWFVSSN